MSGLFGGNNSPMKVTDSGKFKGFLRISESGQKEIVLKNARKSITAIENEIKAILQNKKNTTEYNISIDKALNPDIKMSKDEVIKLLRDFRTFIAQAGLSQLRISENIGTFIQDQQLARSMSEITRCKIRIYMLRGTNFAQRDLFSLSDPYLIMKCGDTVFNERESYQLDVADPSFYKCYDFAANFPGSPLL